MNTKQIFPVLVALSTLFFAWNGRAVVIIPTGNGNWSSTVADAPWPSGIVPNPTNDAVFFLNPYNVTVDSTNVSIQYIYGDGTVTMAAGSTLTVVGDNAGAYGTQWLTTLDTSAPSNTVIYTGNTFWAKHQNYYNLAFINNTTNIYDFYSGDVGVDGDGKVPITVFGDMTVVAPIGPGQVKVQQGDNFTVGGNLIIGTNCTWDSSSFVLTVSNNTTITGLMIDLDGALGLDNFLGSVTVNKSLLGWNLTDVTQWNVGGSLTNNNGTIIGKEYASIAFNGTGNIVGKSFKIPTMTINGTYAIGATITLSTNTPIINGTIVFDIARTNQIVLNAGTNWIWYTTNGTLSVINSSNEPAVGNSFQLFKCSNGNYAGQFASVSLPSLSGSKIWIDNLLTSGSILVGSGSAPSITLTRSGALLTLSWDSTNNPGYSVLALTNSAGVITNVSHAWLPTGSGTNSPVSFTINPANPPVFYRLSHP
jgi:hypothetical protein